MTFSGSDLPGLSSLFNRYYGMLEAALPVPSRGEDGVADLLSTGISGLMNSDKEAAELVQQFSESCAAFRSNQYRLNTDDKFSDARRDRWLSILVLDKEWAAAVKALIGGEMPDILQKADTIIFHPVSSNEKGHIRVELKSSIPGIDQERWHLFDTHIRRPLNVRSAYDSTTQELTVLGSSLCPPQDENANRLMQGKIPKWLEMLLEWDAVKVLEVAYPDYTPQKVAIGGVLRKMVVFPACPPEWRQNDPQVLDKALSYVTDALETGTGPHFTLVTKLAEEWFPFIEYLLQRFREAWKDLKSIGSPALEKEFLDISLTRRIGISEEQIGRCESEYRLLAESLLLPNEAVDGHQSMSSNKGFVVAIDSRLSACLLDRIGNLDYLRAAVDLYVDISQDLGNRLRSKVSSSVSTIPDDPRGKTLIGRKNESSGQPEFRRPKINTDLMLCATVMETLHKSMVLLNDAMTLSKFLLEKADFAKFEWMGIPSEEQTDIQRAASFFAEIIVNSDDRYERVHALSALLYLLKSNDIIPDSEVDGMHDDAQVLAQTIKVIKKGKKYPVPASINNWALDIDGNRDVYLTSDDLSEIEAQLKFFNEALQNLKSRS